MGELSVGITILALLIWLYLLGWRGQFWRTDQRLPEFSAAPAAPAICAIIPARNEADLLPQTLRSLLTQEYGGAFHIFLVDDHSTDGTADVARDVAAALDQSAQLTVLSAQPLPPGWTGKLWALEQGTQAALALQPDYCLLTDADIAHDRTNLHRLVNQAEQHHLDLVSLMVLLRCASFWEKLLIPAFVFFFQKLYPFRWVNHPGHPTAAAAGGCSLIRRSALIRIGGIGGIRSALIDDCALAQAVKGHPTHPRSTVDGMIAPVGGPIWLGLTTTTQSLRPYPSLQTIWDMIARTAFTQLQYSPWLLVGTVFSMAVVYLVPPIGFLVALWLGNWPIALLNLITYLLMTFAYWPIVRFYRCGWGFALALPIIALLYTLMTLDSARRHWQGQGGSWKGRVYGVEGHEGSVKV
jgi:hopene-associated glycosyltransferase HpnB